MKRLLMIGGGAIAGVAILGVGGLIATETWLGDRVESNVETQLTDAAGVPAAVGNAEVNLLKQQIALSDIQLDNVAGFQSENLLTIQGLVLDKAALHQKPMAVQTATIDGIHLNIDGDLKAVPTSLVTGDLPDLNLLQIAEKFGVSASATPDSGEGTAIAQESFTIQELHIRGAAITLNLDVPWSETPLQHNLDIPEVTLTDVTSENIGDKLMAGLGEPVIRDLQLFFFEEVLPGSLQQLSESIPAEIDLSGISLPEGTTLPETINLPSIKLPQGRPAETPE